MPKKKKAAEYLNSANAQRVANRGMNAAFTQSNGVPTKGADGKWTEGAGYTQTKQGRLSVNGRNTQGASTWTMTPKNADGSPVLGKNGKPRQSGRSQIATRRQRYYDVRVGLGLAGG